MSCLARATSSRLPDSGNGTGEPGTGYLLLAVVVRDFGSSLGSGSSSAQQPRGGNEYLIDGGQILKGLVSFGVWERGWMKVRYPKDPSLGNIEADFFEPRKWKTEYPQPAFEQMDAADAFWAARIASRFSDPMIRGIVRSES